MTIEDCLLAPKRTILKFLRYDSGRDEQRNERETSHLTYRKIPKISPRAYIFERPFLRGLYSEGLRERGKGKFAFQNRLS